MFRKSNTTLIDFNKLGYIVRANIILKIDDDNIYNIREYLMNHNSVNSAYKINNGFNFIMEGVFKDVKEMDEFIDELEIKFKLIEHKSFFILEDVKREGFLTSTDSIFE